MREALTATIWIIAYGWGCGLTGLSAGSGDFGPTLFIGIVMAFVAGFVATKRALS